MAEQGVMQRLLETLPQVGRVEWIGVRPARGEPMRVLRSADIQQTGGIIGDRFKGRASSKRQVTLIQHEHLTALGSLLHRNPIDPALLRRNIAVSGINLLALKGKRFQIGDAILEYTGLCHPCSKMETALGPGGYNAMRGHGGITARVIQPGRVSLDDQVLAVP